MSNGNWLVLGSGVSGLSAAKFLRSLNNNVTIFDQKKIDPIVVNVLEKQGVKIEQSSLNLDNFSFICPSPGIPLSNTILVEAKQKRIPIISEIQIALDHYKGKIIAVTGTNGKSTTVSMIQHILESLGLNSSLSGNIGTPPTKLILEKKIKEILVLELSSYQLETTEKLNPDVAIITNFTEDHLARHLTMSEYFRCKWRVFEGIGKNSLAVVDGSTKTFAEENNFDFPDCKIKCYPSDMDSNKINSQTTGIFEKHNLINAFFAIEAVKEISNFEYSDIANKLCNYRGLSHRFERFVNTEELEIINDSKATNIDSTLVALESIDKKTILFLGGKPKGESFSKIKSFKDRIETIIAFGEAKDEICKDLASDFNITSYPSLREAIHSLSTNKLDSKSILFSPACASFDEFQNFEQRGDFFKKEVKLVLDI